MILTGRPIALRIVEGLNSEKPLLEPPYQPLLSIDVRALVAPRRSAPQAVHPYRSAPAADVLDFESREMEATAATVFQEWASQMPAAPRDVRELIHSSTARLRLIGRMVTRIEGRRPAVEGGRRDTAIQVAPAGGITGAFAWGREGVACSEEELTRDADLVCTVTRGRALEPGDLPSEIPASWLESHWAGLQVRLSPGERIVSQSFTLLKVPSVEVTYAVGEQRQTISFEGMRLLAPPRWKDHLFHARAESLRWLKGTLAALPVMVFLFYLARGEHFLNGALAGLVLTTATLGALLYGFRARRTLGRPAGRWLAAALAPAMVMGVMAVRLEPRAETVRSYLEDGELAKARMILRALDDAADPELASLWNELHVQLALQATSCGAVAEELARIPEDAPRRKLGVARADALALQAAKVAVEAGEIESAEASLECGSTALRSGTATSSLRARIALGGGRLSLNKRDWAAVLESADSAMVLGDGDGSIALLTELRSAVLGEVVALIERSRRDQDPRHRLADERKAVELWTRYLPTEGSAELAELRAAMERDEAAVARLDARVAQEGREVVELFAGEQR